jgi:hypothetical protein
MPASMLVYLTFGLPIFVFHATPEQFRTGRLLENVFYFRIRTRSIKRFPPDLRFM